MDQKRLKLGMVRPRPVYLVGGLCVAIGLSSVGQVLGAARLSVELIDAESKEAVPGWFRILDSDGHAIEFPELYSRGVGLRAGHPARTWYSVYEKQAVMLPKNEIYVEAFSGLNSERTRRKLDLRFFDRLSIKLPIRELLPLRSRGWFAGNTHLHLKGIERSQADHYLKTVPVMDRLDLLFVSYLERASEDRTYVSNEYSSVDLYALDGDGFMMENGQEHRHNFGAWGEGYGHVMFLKIPRNVEPVSIGPGIAGAKFDFPSLRHGIEEAREMNAFIIWCHNQYGTEDVPNWLDGKIDAQNIFDGGSRGLFADTFYRYLNVGLSVPFSTGTDWFMDDFSRVFVHLSGSVGVGPWLDGLKKGRSFISNGPLLEFEVEGKTMGTRLDLSGEQSVGVKARAIGRHDFGGLELILNGQKLETIMAQAVGKTFEAVLDTRVLVSEPSWLAARISGGGTGADGNQVVPANTPKRGSGKNVNEMGETLFAHTSPIYLDMNGQTRFHKETAEELIAEMEVAQSLIREKGAFESMQQLDEVLLLYRTGISNLRERIANRSAEAIP